MKKRLSGDLEVLEKRKNSVTPLYHLLCIWSSTAWVCARHKCHSATDYNEVVGILWSALTRGVKRAIKVDFCFFLLVVQRYTHSLADCGRAARGDNERKISVLKWHVFLMYSPSWPWQMSVVPVVPSTNTAFLLISWGIKKWHRELKMLCFVLFGWNH